MSFLRNFPKARQPKARRRSLFYTDQQPDALFTAFRRLSVVKRLTNLKIVLPSHPLDPHNPDESLGVDRDIVAVATRRFFAFHVAFLDELAIVAESTTDPASLPRALPRSLDSALVLHLRQLTLCDVTLSPDSLVTLVECGRTDRLSLIRVVAHRLPETIPAFDTTLQSVHLAGISDDALTHYLTRCLRADGAVSVEYIQTHGDVCSNLAWDSIAAGDLGGIGSLTLTNASFTDDGADHVAMWQDVNLAALGDLHLKGADFEPAAFETFCTFLASSSRLVSLRLSNFVYSLTEDQRALLFASIAKGGVKWLFVSAISTTQASSFAKVLGEDSTQLEIVSLEIFGNDDPTAIEEARRDLLSAARNNKHLGVIRDDERSFEATILGLYGLHVTNVEPDDHCPNCSDEVEGVGCSELDHDLIQAACVNDESFRETHKKRPRLE